MTLEHYFSDSGPGAALGVCVAGETTISCVGLSDLERGVPITPQTPFDLASATKTFTACAVLLLVAEGKVALGSPAAELVDGLARPAGDRVITVEDLLGHTSGLTDYLADGVYTPPAEATDAHIRAMLPKWAATARPGKAYEYSNTNYVVLKDLIEAVSGVSFATFLETRIFEPHGLAGTFVAGVAGGETETETEPMARGYQNLGYGLPAFVPTEGPAVDTLGDGGIVSCLEDMLRWNDALWNGDVLPPSLFDRMTTPTRPDGGSQADYGLGLQIEIAADGRKWLGHGGSWIHSTVLAGRYIDAQATIVVLSNELMAPVERIAQRAIDRVEAADPRRKESRDATR